MICKTASVTLAILTLACSAPPPKDAPPPTPPASPTPTPDPDRKLPEPLPSIAARVNGQPIPMAGVHKLAKKGTSTHGKVPLAYRQAVQELVDRELLFQEALDRRLSADDAAIQKAYDEARVDHPDDAEWARFLSVEFLDPQSFRTELRTRFTIEALVRQEDAKIPPVTDEEARRAYDANPSASETGERIEAHQIFFGVPSRAKPADRDAVLGRAEAVLARIRKGEDFETLARQVSEDRGSSKQGGKMPPFARGQTELPIELAAFALQPGKVSEVILTRQGCHILRVDARLPSIKVSFADLEDRIKASLRAERRQQRLAALLAELRAKARIETYL